MFKDYYYLKEELVEFCKKEGLQATGSKQMITERIAHYLDTGEKKVQELPNIKNSGTEQINLSTIIETPFICSENYRLFLKKT